MYQGYFEELPYKNVKLKTIKIDIDSLSVKFQLELGETKVISFEINDELFELYIYRSTDLNWYPIRIQHVPSNLDETCCTFCAEQTKFKECGFFSRYLDEVFEVLKEHKSIHLRMMLLT